jgi:predicted HicB family RNase H-like nuclease
MIQVTIKLSLVALIFSLMTIHAGIAGEKAKGQKVIDFEDEVVEGLNKRPFDSLSQISERNKKRHKPHLYRKRVGFRTETADSLHTMKFTP